MFFYIHEALRVFAFIVRLYVHVSETPVDKISRDVVIYVGLLCI